VELVPMTLQSWKFWYLNDEASKLHSTGTNSFKIWLSWKV
jgi:hypothetical protein